MGKRGTLVIEASLRAEYGLEEGQPVVQEPTQKGILIRASVPAPVRHYMSRDKAAFLLNAAANHEEYLQAQAEVKAMGLDPARIPHRRAK
jgi:bifunctional DNA-binding transcriptional regulator/antitoxin component of YhaV-PrlF toxin-antitoxin module